MLKGELNALATKTSCRITCEVQLVRCGWHGVRMILVHDQPELVILPTVHGTKLQLVVHLVLSTHEVF
jgi:hypothetical protein